jgi:AraC-like DNA-binding protein
LNNGTVVGSILAGPFLLDKPDSTLIQDIGKKYNIPTNAQFDMYDELSNVKIMPPTHVTHAARLLNYLCHDLTEKKKKPNIKQIKLHQQARIGESIQMYKDIESEGSNYPYEKEKELITKVKLGNIADAKGILNDLLGYVFFSEGNNLDAIKTRAVELSSLLSRAAIEGGAATDRILKMNNYFLRTIQQINNLEDLCYRLQEVVIEFTEAMFHQIPSKNSEVIKNAIKYITKNFSRQITLEEVASVVHLSSSYFSTLFKECTGSTFKEYLNMIRVEESKRLLSNTDYSIIDIAIATGFESQSYFTKIFKRYTGYTPKQFR